MVGKNTSSLSRRLFLVESLSSFLYTRYSHVVSLSNSVKYDNYISCADFENVSIHITSQSPCSSKSRHLCILPESSSLRCFS